MATKQIAADGTIKLLVRLQDGLEVEAVVMTYDPTTRAQSKQDAAAAGQPVLKGRVRHALGPCLRSGKKREKRCEEIQTCRKK